MKNKKGNVAVIAIIIIIVAITAGVIGWMLAKKSQPLSQQQQANQSESTITSPKIQESTQTNDSTIIYDTRQSVLDIFKNLKIPFTFRYNDNWQLEETKGGVTLELTGLDMNESEKIFITPSIKCEKTNNITKIKDQPWCYFDESKKASVRDWCESGLPNDVISKVAAGDENEADGILLYTIIYKTKSGSFQRTCVTKDATDYVTITFPKVEQYNQISNTILGSFRFLN